MSRLSNTSPRGLNDALTSHTNGYAKTTVSTVSAVRTKTFRAFPSPLRDVGFRGAAEVGTGPATASASAAAPGSASDPPAAGEPST
jgi:hypothetical protein